MMSFHYIILPLVTMLITSIPLIQLEMVQLRSASYLDLQLEIDSEGC